MSVTENSVRFGLDNVYYAPLTETVSEHGVITFSYGTPVRIPGAVNLSLDSAGDRTPFYADNIIYYMNEANNGYEGEIEIANVPNSMLTDVFGMTVDSAGVITESANGETKYVALLFRAQGDVAPQDYVLYKCAIGRPNIGSATIAGSKEPQTMTLPITIMPRADYKVKSHAPASVSRAIKDNWYNEVYDGAGSFVAITAFIINGVAGVIMDNRIFVSLPYGTNITSLSPTIATSPGATVSPTSGTSKDFTSAQTYTVTASDVSITKTYTVEVSVEREDDD